MIRRDPVLVCLALGSNLGGRLDHLRGGVRGLEEGGVVVERVSRVVETPPVGYEDQPPFLNLALGGRWGDTPKSLLALIRDVEEDAGRIRSFPDAPRTLDVDLVFFGERIVRSRGLTVPHPRWRERTFVARPLAEIVPDVLDPETGWRVEEVVRSWPMGPEEIRVVGRIE